jgi:LPS-assembly protein
MSLHVIQALVLRYLFLYTRSPMRLIELIFWPVVELVIWGYLTVFIQENTTGDFPRIIVFLLGAMILWDDGRRANFVLGRSFRSGDTEVFSTTSGLAGKASDWIVAVEAEPMRGVSLFARTRLDAEGLAVRRAEAGANLQLKRGSGYFRYLKEEAASGSGRRENADLGGEVFLNENWGVTFYGNRDIAASAWVIRDIGVVFRDGCTRLDVIYRQEDIQVGQLGSSTSVNIRLTLATLGGPLGTR